MRPALTVIVNPDLKPKVRVDREKEEEDAFIRRVIQAAARPDGGLLLVWEQERYPNFAISFLMVRFSFRLSLRTHDLDSALQRPLNVTPTYQPRGGTLSDGEFTRRHLRDLDLMHVKTEGVAEAFSRGPAGPYSLFHRDGVPGGVMSPLLRRRLLDLGATITVSGGSPTMLCVRTALLTMAAEIGRE